MHIRNAQDGDFYRCFEIARAAWPFFKERESIYHLFCKFFSNTSLVCEDESGEVVAFLFGFLSQVDPAEAYIHLVVVHPEAQGRGVGSALYRKFFELAARLGASRVRLIVNPDNAASHSFHRRLGFAPDVAGKTIVTEGVLAVEDYNGPSLHMVPYARAL